MADLPELEFLVDAFPHYPRLELASRLLCAASPEVLFNELAVENSSTSKNSQPSEAARGFPPEVTALAELFPSAHKDSLAAALQQNGGCMDKTIEALLEHQPVHRLAAVSGLPEPELRPYVARHKHDVLRALADVIAQYRRRTRVRTSRVQARAGTALADRDTYVLDERSAAFVLLLESVWAEPALRGINFDFLRKLLVFFQGDVSRVLDVARLYIEAGSQAVTYDGRLGFVDMAAPDPAPGPAAAAVLRRGVVLPGPPGLVSARPPLALAAAPRPPAAPIHSPAAPAPAPPPHAAAAAANAPLEMGAKNTPGCAPRMQLAPRRAPPRQAAPPARPRGLGLDLHGYTVAEARVAAGNAVSAWWAEEQDARVLDGHLGRYGSRAEFVEPLRIVTGRGLHSAGGAPKIRLAVIRLLGLEGYLVDENVGSVVVVGKRARK